MIGRTLGHYRITEKIGQGGMGEVYRARDERLDRDVAIKVLPGGTLSDEEARKRFRKEALTLSKLNHPHIATIFDFDTQDGTDFLVMEFVAGETLKEKLQARPLPEKDIAKLGGEIAEALEEAHEQGIIHRDLKPGNIALTPKGHVKVLDFGIAKLLRSQEDAAEAPTVDTLTKTVGRAGTLPYMAPEQLRGEEIDARTDIYALGATLYEAATGRRPFDAPTAEAVIGDILKEVPPAPSKLHSGVGADLERTILKCLEKEPENRYQHANEVAVDLRRLSTTTAATIPSSPHTRAWGKPVGWLVGTGLAVIAALALLVGFNVGGLRERLFGVRPGQITSIAVLPLDNMMGDTEQDYFVEGMHEALITELSKISALKVISRTSTMPFGETELSVPQIAERLGVDAVIEGSVLRAGNTVRVTTQLIDGRTDEHLWADNFDRELENILALHSDVARAIAREIRITVTPEEETRLTRARPVNPQAHDAYLRGRYYYLQLRVETRRKAEEYFKQAIEIDPTYALPYAGLTDLYTLGGGAWLKLPTSEVYAQARELAAKALELDDSSSEAHTAMAEVLSDYDWNFAAADKEFRRAIELNPGNGLPRLLYAEHLSFTGRHGEALTQVERSHELDPLSKPADAILGSTLIRSRQYDRAIEKMQVAVELHPDNSRAWTCLARGYAFKGMYEEAITAQKQRLSSVGRDPNQPNSNLAVIYAMAGRTAEARKIMAAIEKLAEQQRVNPVGMAAAYAALGEKDRAMEWLERGYQRRFLSMLQIKESPWFDPLRDDPRFQDLLRRMNFPP